MADTSFNYVTLVPFGGTPVRLADQTGAPLPTTGTGALVFANGPVLNNPILNGMTFQGGVTLGPIPQTGSAGSAASPVLNFTNALQTGFYSTGVNLGITVAGASVGFWTTTGLQIQDLALSGAVTAGNWNGNPVPALYGGTGQGGYTVGDILYADTPTTLARLAAAGSGLVLTSNGVGVAPSWQAGGGGGGGVTTIGFGSTGLTPSAATAGVVTVSGTLIATHGGTGQNTYVVGDILYADTTTTLARLPAAGAGLVLTSNGAAAAPSWQAGAGGAVASVSFGTTGLLPSTATTGAITVTGTLAVANGGTGVTSKTGTGSVVLSTTPTLVTPVLGAATATSINKVAITAPAAGSTLTIADGKTLTASNTITLAGTDGSTLNVSTGGTLGNAAFQGTGTSGGVLPFLNTANTWSLLQTYTTGVNTPAVTSGAGANLTLTAASGQTLVLAVSGITAAINYGGGGGGFLFPSLGTTVTLGGSSNRWLKTWTQDLDASGQTTLLQVAETFTAPSISGGTLTINLATGGTVFNVSNNANITTFTISGAPGGLVSSFTLVLTANGAAFTQSWGASVKWPSGNAPTLTSTNGKKDVLMFFTNDGGTTWYGFVSGQNF